MNANLSHVIVKIHSIPDRPHSSSPEFTHWFADQVWRAAVQHCVSFAGPKCSADILDGTIQKENGGPGWMGIP